MRRQKRPQPSSRRVAASLPPPLPAQPPHGHRAAFDVAPPRHDQRAAQQHAPALPPAAMKEALGDLDSEALRQLLGQVIDMPQGRSLLGQSMGHGGPPLPDDEVGVPPLGAVGSASSSHGVHAALLAEARALERAAPATEAISSWLRTSKSDEVTPGLLRSIESVEELGALRLSLRQVEYAQTVQRRQLEEQNRELWSRAAEAVRAQVPSAAMERDWQDVQRAGRQNEASVAERDAVLDHAQRAASELSAANEEQRAERSARLATTARQDELQGLLERQNEGAEAVAASISDLTQEVQLARETSSARVARHSPARRGSRPELYRAVCKIAAREYPARTSARIGSVMPGETIAASESRDGYVLCDRGWIRTIQRGEQVLQRVLGESTDEYEEDSAYDDADDSSSTMGDLARGSAWAATPKEQPPIASSSRRGTDGSQLPPGWELRRSRTYGTVYYFCPATGVTSWKLEDCLPRQEEKRDSWTPEPTPAPTRERKRESEAETAEAAAAAPEKPSAGAGFKPHEPSVDDLDTGLIAFLTNLRLQHCAIFFVKLGATEITHLSDLEPRDLEELSLKPLERRRLVSAIIRVQGSTAGGQLAHLADVDSPLSSHRADSFSEVSRLQSVERSAATHGGPGQRRKMDPDDRRAGWEVAWEEASTTGSHEAQEVHSPIPLRTQQTRRTVAATLTYSNDGSGAAADGDLWAAIQQLGVEDSAQNRAQVLAVIHGLGTPGASAAPATRAEQLLQPAAAPAPQRRLQPQHRRQPEPEPEPEPVPQPEPEPPMEVNTEPEQELAEMMETELQDDGGGGPERDEALAMNLSQDQEVQLRRLESINDDDFDAVPASADQIREEKVGVRGMNQDETVLSRIAKTTEEAKREVAEAERRAQEKVLQAKAEALAAKRMTEDEAHAMVAEAQAATLEEKQRWIEERTALEDARREQMDTDRKLWREQEEAERLQQVKQREEAEAQKFIAEQQLLDAERRALETEREKLSFEQQLREGERTTRELLERQNLEIVRSSQEAIAAAREHAAMTEVDAERKILEAERRMFEAERHKLEDAYAEIEASKPRPPPTMTRDEAAAAAIAEARTQRDSTRDWVQDSIDALQVRFLLKMMNFLLKTMDILLKMMGLYAKNDEFCRVRWSHPGRAMQALMITL